MARKKTPDILGIALQGEFPVAIPIEKPAVKSSGKKKVKKTTRKKKTGTAPTVKPASKKLKKTTPLNKPGLSPSIKDILAEAAPIVKDFVKNTVKEAVIEAVQLVADREKDIEILKNRLDSVETRMEQAAVELENRADTTIANLKDKLELTLIEIETIQDQIHSATTHEEKPEPVIEPASAPEPEPVIEPASAPEPEPVIEPAANPEPEPVIEPAANPEPEPEPDDNTDNLSNNSGQDRQHPETDIIEPSAPKMPPSPCLDAFKTTILKTIVNMHDRDRIPFIEIARHLENGGLNNFTGDGKWDEESVRSLYWNGL